MPTYVLTKPLHLAKTRHERASLNIRSFSILREYNSDCQADYHSSYHFIQLCFFINSKMIIKQITENWKENLHLLGQFQQWKSNWICSIFHLFFQKKYSIIIFLRDISWTIQKKCQIFYFWSEEQQRNGKRGRHEYKVSIFIKSSLPRIFLSTDQKQHHHHRSHF